MAQIGHCDLLYEVCEPFALRISQFQDRAIQLRRVPVTAQDSFTEIVDLDRLDDASPTVGKRHEREPHDAGDQTAEQAVASRTDDETGAEDDDPQSVKGKKLLFGEEFRPAISRNGIGPGRLRREKDESLNAVLPSQLGKSNCSIDVYGARFSLVRLRRRRTVHDDMDVFKGAFGDPKG
jgi:hypothetical protein